MEKNTLMFVGGVVSGLALGAAAVTLLSSKRGKELTKDATDAILDLKEKTQDFIDETKKSFKDIYKGQVA